MKHQIARPLTITLLITLVIPTFSVGVDARHSSAYPAYSAQGNSRLFPETGKTVGGRFLEYWDSHGGLAQQGFPISEVIQERSDTDGKIYDMQYFERAVFERHPENPQPNDVLLSLLGTFQYSKTYVGGGLGQKTSTDNPYFFPETQHTLGGKFRTYWETHGGLAQQGYPISDEFTEVSSLDGKPYVVQYFQRAVFELHPENANTPYEVLLSHLGKYRLVEKQTPPTPTATVTIAPQATATPEAKTPFAGEYRVMSGNAPVYIDNRKAQALDKDHAVGIVPGPQDVLDALKAAWPAALKSLNIIRIVSPTELNQYIRQPGKCAPSLYCNDYGGANGFEYRINIEEQADGEVLTLYIAVANTPGDDSGNRERVTYLSDPAKARSTSGFFVSNLIYHRGRLLGKTPDELRQLMAQDAVRKAIGVDENGYYTKPTALEFYTNK
ncbi:MAG TPA: hypothetical protein VJ183_05710 [Chloroflexia bacterium]|nr:hypothetical protein [Chloroflexia bacterium]